jgi:4-hydroxy-4-methyl-2-oxoglutarate aldolase
MDTFIGDREFQLLAKYDTPTVCNVIELFNVQPRNTGYMDRRIQACFPELPPMVGYASTATFRSAAPAHGDSYSNLREQIESFSELPGPAVVVFQDLDDPPVGATFGEVMCTTYKSFGAIGLITSGAGRDLDQVANLAFPIFTAGTICSHGYSHIPSISVPIHVGGIMVNPGDLLHADRNGVTKIPGEIAGEVAHACSEFMAAETAFINEIKGDNITAQNFADAEKTCRSMIEKLRTRVARR